MRTVSSPSVISSSATPEASTSSISFLSLRMSTGCSLKMSDGSVQRQVVTVGAEAGDGADGDIGKIGMGSKRLARRHIGQMHFDEWQCRAQQRIAQGDAGVGVGGGIEYNATDVLVAGRVYARDQLAFVVGLKAVERVAEGKCTVTERGFDLGQCLRAVEIGFAGADRKSTRLNSSHVAISYAVFCLKKKKKRRRPPNNDTR